MHPVLQQGSKRIDASDVVSLLREVYPEGIKGRNEAEALIAFDREFADPAPEWRGFLADAIADHLLRRAEPFGALTQEKAEWLVGQIAPHGRIATARGLETLLHTLEQAQAAPVWPAVFALNEFRLEIIAGEGPAMERRPHLSRMIDREDVTLLRRILACCPATRAAALTREEADALFDLHDIVAGADNDPAFDDLFFRAIASYLMGASGCEVPPRATALAREPKRAAGAEIAAEPCEWLARAIMRDGRPTAAERALLALVSNAREPDPSLWRLLDRAA